MKHLYRLRIVNRDHTVREVQIPIDAPLALPAEPGARYLLIDAASGAPSRGMTLRREGAALIVEDGTGLVTRVDDFYESDRAAGAVFDVASDDASANLVHITAADTGSGSGHVVWQAAGLDAGTAAAGGAATSAPSSSLGGLGTAGLIGLAAIGLGAAAAGGGGGGSSAPAPAPGNGGSGSGFANAVSVTVVGGPVLPSNDLQVAIYTAEGKLIDIAKLDAQGHISMAIGEYRGVIIAKVAHDGDNIADYLDEATGAGKALGVDLYATGVIAGQNETLTLNLNLLTTLAYLKAIAAAGVDPLAGNGALDAATVNSVNHAVAVAFGLTDLHAQAVVTVNGTTSYNAADGISSAEKYGEILAALSGSDVQHGGNTQETLDRLVAGVVLAVAADGTSTADVGAASALINSGAAVYDQAVGGNILGSLSGQTSPSVLGFALSTAGAHAAIAAGDTLTVTVAFSEAVSVDGRPQLVLDIGGTLVRAVYVGGSGTASLTFTYVVLAGQSDTDGISIPAGQLLLDGAAIRALDDGHGALASHGGMTADANFKVDATGVGGGGSGIASPVGAFDDVGSVTGPLKNGDATDDRSLRLTGSCQPGSTVRIYDGDTLIGTATVVTTADGTTWAYDAAIADGVTYHFRSAVTDAAGTTSTSADAFTVVGDTSAPTTSVGGIMLSHGTSGAEVFTHDASQTVSATLSAALAAGEKLYASLDGGATFVDITSFVSGTTLTWDGVTLLAGSHAIELRLVDAAGNAGPSAVLPYTLDTTAPTIGALVAATDDVGAVTGPLANGSATDDGALVLSGTCEAGSTVAVYDGSTLIGTAVVTGTTWSYTAAVADGVTYRFNAVATDAAGNASAPTASLTVTGDTTAPTASAIAATDDAGLITGPLASGGATDDTSLLLSGTCEAGSTVKIYDGSTLIGTAVVTGTSWSYSATIADATTYSFHSVETDAAGNASAPSASFAVTGDTTAPTTTLSGIGISSDTGVSASDFITNVAGQTITATLSAALGVGEKLYGSLDGGATFVDISSFVSGTTLTWTGVTLGAGPSIELKVGDALGSTGTVASQTYTFDTTAPGAANIAATDDVGSVTGALASGSRTDDSSLVLSGTCEAGSTVRIYDGSTLIGTAVVTGTTWSYSAAIANATTYSFHSVETDAAGNASAPSANFAVTGDTTAPTASAIVATDDVGSVTGALASGSRTDDTSLVLSGTCEAGSTVKIYDGSTLIGTALVTGTTWSYSAAIANATTYSFHSVETDAAGNASAPSANFAVTGDTSAPAASAISATDDVGSVTGALASGSRTDDTALVLSGTCEAGSTVKIYDGSTLVGTAVVTGTSWSYSATIANATTYSFHSVVTDAAGNASAPSANFAVTGDTTAPVASAISATDDAGLITGPLASGGATDDTSLLLSGTCEAGSTVKIYDGSTLIGTAVVTGTTWSYSATIADATTYSFHSVETDAAGNASAPSASFAVTGDTTAPTTTLSGIGISSDTGVSASDFITNVAGQTITATLSAALGVGEKLYGSLNGGTTFVDISSFVSGTTLTWTGVTLGAGPSIQLKVGDALGSTGTVASQVYTLDTTAPSVGGIIATDDVGSITGVLSSGASTDDNELLLSGTCEAGSTVKLYDNGTFIGNATVTGTTWTMSAEVNDGVTLNITAVATDASGNVSAPTAIFTVTGDLTAPSTTLSGIGISSDTGASASDFITTQPSQTITATLSAALGADEKLYGSLDGGTTFVDLSSFVSGTTLTWTGTTLGAGPSIELKVVDAAGNAGTAASQAYTLDTTAPSNSLVGITLSADTGASSTDFITNQASQTITALLSDPLDPGETIYGSLDGGATFIDLSSFVTVSGLSWTGVTLLAGGPSIQLKIVDAAGNSGAVTEQAYTLDTTVPTASAITATDDAGFITGTLTSGASTDDTALVLSGTCEAGSTVKIYDGSTLVGTAVVTGTTWSYTATIADVTTYSFHSVETDAAGNASAPSANFAVTGDTSAPTNTLTGIHISADTGSSSSDFITKVASQTITATLSASLGASEKLYGSLDGGSTFVDVSSYVSGTTLTWTGALLGAGPSIQLKVVNTVGNTGPVATQAYTLDTTAPNASAITATDDAGFITGTLASGASTDDTALVLSGTCEAGSTVDIYDGSTFVGTAVVSGTTWSYSATIADVTTYSFHTVVTDAAGNASAPGASFAVTGDTTAPTTTLSGIGISNDTGASASDLITNVASQTITATLSASLATGEKLYGSLDGGTTFVDVSSFVSGTTLTWTGVTLGAGPSIQLMVVDTVGNTGTVATEAYTLDTTVTASAITATDDVGLVTGVLASGGSTDDTALVLSGTCEAGSTVDIYNGSTLVATAVVTGTTWSYSATVVDGTTYSFHTVETDAAGNTSAPSASFAVTGDSSPPVASAITATDDVGFITGTLTSGASTDDTALVLSGTCEAGSTVKIYDGSTLVGTAVVTGTTWSYSATIADATTYSFHTVETDAGGNVSAPSADFAVTGDTTAPTVTLTSIAISSDTGVSASDFLTKDASQTITATLSTSLATGEKLYGSVDGGTTFVDVSSFVSGLGLSWTGVTLDASGPSIELKVVNAVGNEGPVASQAYTLDTALPVASAIAAMDDVGLITGTLASGGSTDDTGLLLSGTCEAGSTVQIYDGLTIIGTALVSGTSWSYIAGIADATTYNFHTVVIDAAGNESAPSATYVVTGDTTAPSAGGIITATDNVGPVTGVLQYGDTTDDTALALSGNCDAGSTVQIYDGSTLVGTAVVSGTTWSYSATIANGTSYNFNYVETDPVGNVSSPSSSLTVVGDSAAPSVTFDGAKDIVGTVQGTLASGATTDDTLAGLSGTCEPGSTVKIYDGSTLLGAASVSGSNWYFNGSFLDATTYNLHAVATDAAGNASAPTANFVLICDTTPPAVTLTSVTDNVGSLQGALSDLSTTDDTSLTVSGTCEPGATVKVYDDVVFLGTATVTGGTWTCAVALADGQTLALNAVATDATGNSSNPTSTFTVTGDTTAPSVTLTAETLTPGSNATVESNETGTVYLVRSSVTVSNLNDITGAAGNEWNSVSVNNGTSTALPTTGLVDGTYHAYAADAAGNLSLVSTDAVTIGTPTPADSSIVVFDMVDGVSSDHSSRTFDASISYHIYVLVDSENSALNTTPQALAAGSASWGKWSGAANLGSDDLIIFVGTGSAIKGERNNVIEAASLNNGQELRLLSHSGSSNSNPVYHHAVGLFNGTSGGGQQGITLSRTFNDGGNPMAQIIVGKAPVAFFRVTSFSNYKLDTMPVGILQTQHLV